MPWNDQNGGWRSGGRGPWGQGPTGGGTGGPDLEDILRRGQDRLRQLLPGGSMGGRGFLIGGLVVAALWLASGLYLVEPDEQGVVLRFGKFVELTQPGLNYHLPYPIESVETPKVTRINRADMGMRGALGDATVGRGSAVRDVPEESLMLTGDENIVDVDFTVLWRIKNAADFLFNIENQESTVKSVAESSMREIVGGSQLSPILSQGRAQTEAAVQELMQQVLDSYGAGIEITQVQSQKIDPPAAVIDSFRDVQAARADQERLQNEAEAYANQAIPEARGMAAQITEAAEAYRNSVIADARGQASRFNAIYQEYQLAPIVTRERMFLETMERVLGGAEKVVIDQGVGGSGVVPYLPLGELGRRGGAPAAGQGEQQ
jgi:membrane protease subunit HflK